MKRFHHCLLLLALCAGPLSADHHRNAHGNPPPEVFESKYRDTWQRPDWVLDQLELKPDAIVADIGAGSGYFARRIAARVPEGRVIAVDIDPDMLAYLEARANEDRITNIELRLVQPDDPPLDDASVDLIFLSNTLHHIPDRPGYYPKLIRALRPGGRIVNIDFEARPLPVGPQDPDHKLAKTVVLAEFARAGLIVSREWDGLPYQYALEAAPLPSVPNAILLDARTVTSGQPSDAALSELAAIGFRTIVNLRTEAEGSAAEGDKVRGLGMTYINIPISGGVIDEQTRKTFSAALTSRDPGPMLIHCKSANRVGAAYLLHRVLREHVALEAALEEARRIGLRPGLEASITDNMNRQ